MVDADSPGTGFHVDAIGIYYKACAFNYYTTGLRDTEVPVAGDTFKSLNILPRNETYTIPFRLVPVPKESGWQVTNTSVIMPPVNEDFEGLQGLLCVKYSGFHRRNGVEKRVRVAGHHVGTQGVSFAWPMGACRSLRGLRSPERHLRPIPL